MGRTGVDLEAQVQIDKTSQDVVIYTAKDIQSIFSCGRKKAYEIMHSPGFPMFRIDSSLYVEKEALQKWIERNKNKNIET